MPASKTRSGAKRPNLARKVTPGSEKARKQALEVGYKVTIDGTDYVVRTGDITPALARELRAATGSGWQGLQAAMSVDPDIDLLAAFVWLARRIRGERVALDDVEVTYADMLSDGFDIDFADGVDLEVDLADPEA